MTQQQQEHAKGQPAGFKNRVENIAIVGVGGRIGKRMTKALLKTGRHKVTALTRPESTTKPAEGLVVKKVDYNDHAALVEVLKGQDVLIITMAVMAPKEPAMPNEYGIDKTNASLAKDVLIAGPLIKTCEYIESRGLFWVGLTCGLWYEFSLAGEDCRYGFDFTTKTVTFFDEGTTKINTSTWDQCGRAVASLFSLKVLPEDAHNTSPSLSQFRNKPSYISSFLLSQRDMLASVLRVTGARDGDWTIKHGNAQERYRKAVENMQKGDMSGFVRLRYTRVFYRDGGGDYESARVTANALLGLAEEDLDEATR
ncbi:uncharacterized protein Z519_05110 [Cladophialophora bantiana CBS 173.52]|uniref:NAD(P)-binding domain-containing protein n=1 Tax=Cladophialophora bantiana (strain ATCC 10958 / CBS 173.52 / CDC B-1940 / NIH 8579) TaxID=1442370 RepID=A0A0D2HSE4_CLAB1|nr:uncharacterized protein Z519_05110 [Cladophialophora bantiana CBS 173.52]KIW93795.1 hypothetical protein Z519_05110 [Cladophialophora bantiana CBS 173.52]